MKKNNTYRVTLKIKDMTTWEQLTNQIPYPSEDCLRLMVTKRKDKGFNITYTYPKEVRE